MAIGSILRTLFSKPTEPVPSYAFFWTQFFYAFMMVMGFCSSAVKYVLRKLHIIRVYTPPSLYCPEGYAPLFQSFDYFWQQNFMNRIRASWSRGIVSAPSTWIDCFERVQDPRTGLWQYTDPTVHRALNLGSYNYFNFGERVGNTVATARRELRHGLAVPSVRADAGTTALHRAVELQVADFVGKEDAILCPMGFATNAMLIPLLAGPGDLILSDTLNHSSIVTGARTSGAKIVPFLHNDFAALDRLLSQYIAAGNTVDCADGAEPQPWKRVWVIAEGIYSMEGEILELPTILMLKKRHHFYLYIDEAHSVGCLGPRGGGVCDHWGVDPAEVDCLMGTVSKSFASTGGYIAANRDVIQHLRRSLTGTLSESMPMPCLGMISETMREIRYTEQGARRIEQIHALSYYMYRRLNDLGLVVYGTPGSPVMCVIVYVTSKLRDISKMMLDRGIATVVVGWPACPVYTCRLRFCLSAGHTKKDVDYLIDHLAQLGPVIGIDYNNRTKWYQKILP